MIDPVSNRGYYEYRKINTQMSAGMETGEKFALNYDGREKDSDQKDDKKIEERDGVIAEFSGQSGSRQEGVGSSADESKTQAQAQSTDFGQSVEQVRGFIGRLTKAITDFFAGIKNSLLAFWNSDGAAETEENAVQAEDASEERVTEEFLEMQEEGTSRYGAAQGMAETPETAAVTVPDPKAPDYVEQIQNYLEQSGQTAYARNSDLLTYYDRSGRIVQMNGADKNRILHGDRGYK